MENISIRILILLPLPPVEILSNLLKSFYNGRSQHHHFPTATRSNPLASEGNRCALTYMNLLVEEEALGVLEGLATGLEEAFILAAYDMINRDVAKV